MTEHINDRFDEPVDAEVVVEPIVDADDAKEIPAEEALATAKQNAKELGETLLEAASTAAYTRSVLEGSLPVPGPIALQVQHIVQLADKI